MTDSGRTSRRHLLRWAAGIGGGALAVRFGAPRIARYGPIDALDQEHVEFAESCFDGLDRSLLWDLHAHVVGTGSGGSGCEVSPSFMSHRHPWLRFQYEMYLASSNVTDVEQADAEYLDRLLELHRAANPTGRLVLLGFDRAISDDGTESEGATAFHTPNDYVLGLAQQHSDVEAGLSVHPYRADAVERLDAGARAGARLVKWLPSSMGIDPSSPRCDKFYERLAELGMPLLTHAGREMAVPGSSSQEFGNPLRLRRALEAGVRVIVAHCASDGTSLNESGDAGEESFDLFMQMMSEPRWEGLLFGEISAMTLLNRSGGPLRRLLLSEGIHERLLNGSDYPMCAIRPLVSPKVLELRGYLSADDRRACQAVLSSNPLLADFVVKRSLRIRRDGRTHRFSPSVFETARVFSAV